ncbi:kinase-like domain-containing protein [Suillus paluster]|uniref:kinase-like domain-containing protein n=1 Tax=Suillus paluster TaxID=48578 RepID=UPI001B869C32|nr:kinase-like domain-containing protein [Suillus paluster]KAG1745364.1 kinase-like domain-containing protein [Suillus paluster]
MPTSPPHSRVESLAGTSTPPISNLALAADLTDQIFGTIKDYVAGGAFGNVYRCEWRQESGTTVKVAVKSFRFYASEQDLRRFRREAAIWAHLVHDNIVTLYGTTEGFGPSSSLVSQWFPHGTLLRLITEQGATLGIRSKLKLLHGIASGLYYLHSFPVVHGDITSSNILVDIKDGEYKACLTDFGLSNVIGELVGAHPVEGSTVRPGAVRWTAPELLGRHHGVKPTTQNDMYSFGRVMYHVLTSIIPWRDIDEYRVIQKILNGEDISRPEIPNAMSDMTNACWNWIERCWSVDPSARPSALEAMDFVKSELEALTDNESHQPPQSPLETLIVSSIQTDLSAVSPLSMSGSFNVLLFGETGVGKSSIINLIMGQDAAQTSPDAEPCTLTHTAYEVILGIRRFKLWEVSSIDSMGFFQSLFYKWRLKKTYKKLYKDDGVYLLLYCMRGSRAQRAMIRDYKFFTDVVGSSAGPGRVPVAAVVNNLEDYSTDMDKWWLRNEDNLGKLGMRFSAHACITSLPQYPSEPPGMRARRLQSQRAIRTLIHESYQAGRTPGNSNPPSISCAL